jgi:uncharacterized damage-inducible protein DinB
MFEQESALSREEARVFAPDFAGGTPPSTDASLYPAWDEVVQRYDTVMRQVVQQLSFLRDDELGQPLKGRMPDALRDFFPTNEATLLRLINHDAYHRGQIAMLAKL